jgi:hypothetical protein
MKKLMMYLNAGTVGPFIISDEQAIDTLNAWREGREISTSDDQGTSIFVNTRGVVAVTVTEWKE